MAIAISGIWCRAHVSFQIYLETTTIKVPLIEVQALELISSLSQFDGFIIYVRPVKVPKF